MNEIHRINQKFRFKNNLNGCPKFEKISIFFELITEKSGFESLNNGYCTKLIGCVKI